MMASGVPEVEVQSITVVDGNRCNSATQLAAFVGKLRQTTGIDAAQIANKLGSSKTKPVQQVAKIEASEADGYL